MSLRRNCSEGDNNEDFKRKSKKSSCITAREIEILKVDEEKKKKKRFTK